MASHKDKVDAGLGNGQPPFQWIADVRQFVAVTQADWKLSESNRAI